MKLSLICFTGSGAELSACLIKGLSSQGHECRGYVLEQLYGPFRGIKGLEPLKTTLQQWAGEQFGTRDGLVFIGAAGIAVRTIAPWVKDKRTDPAVVAVDDTGQFSISLLSGHFGGANALAEEIAEITGGTSVITTATDIHGRFAVDNFAKEQGLWLSDRKTAKTVSADVLAERPVGFFSDFPMEGNIPEGFIRKECCKRCIWITVKRHPGEADPLNLFLQEGGEMLRLVPRIVILGIGCKKNTEKETIKAVVEDSLSRWNIEERSVFAVATIDLKKEEQGLAAFAREQGLSFQAYPAGRLMRAEGYFSPSPFVKEVTGADNVCERAAMSLAEDTGGGRLIMKKQAGGGVAVAAAVQNWRIKL